MTKSRNILKPRVAWSENDVAILRRDYPDSPTIKIAKELGRELYVVYKKAKQLGLAKSKEYMESPAACRLRRGDNVGAAFRYPKGHAPANKGLRRPGYSPGNMAKTQFKKGRLASEAKNYVPIGTEKYDVKRKSIVRKITDDQSIYPAGRWRPVHVIIWEAVNGKVPPGHIVIFKPGMKTFDSSKITIDHVELVTLADNMRRNTIHNQHKEIADTYRLIGAVTRQINKRIKNEK